MEALAPKLVKLVTDPYTGKKYGDESFEQFNANASTTLNYYSNKLASLTRLGSLMIGESDDPFARFGQGYVPPLQAAQEGVRSATNYTSITKDNYIQSDRVVDSYAKNPDGWNKYFESSYKNPRIAESNLSEAQFLSQGNAPSALAIKGKSTASSPKTIGTGTGLTSVGLNPFGRLDAGLGI